MADVSPEESGGTGTEGVVAWICAGLAIACLILAADRWRCERQLLEWARQLEETDESSNLRLGTGVRSRGFLRACMAVNERMEKGRQAGILRENADRELKAAIVSVSHDIRTPLAGASGYVQLLEREESPEQKRRYLDIIKRRLADLENILEELFMFTRLADGEYRIACESLDPFPVLCDVLAGFYERLTEGGMEPRLHFAQLDRENAAAAGKGQEALPAAGKEVGHGEGQIVSVYASEEELKRIFSNLIQNALRYGGGSLEIGQEGGRLWFSNPVAQGREPDADRIFDRFYRADGARHTAGAGLGLASVKGLMEKMGGSASAQAQDGKLTVWLLFRPAPSRCSWPTEN